MLAAVFDVDRVISRLDTVLHTALRGGSGDDVRRLFSITLEVPELSECRCPALSGNSIYWARSGRRCCRIGLGMALELRASGGRRFTQLEHEFEGLRRSWIHRDPEGTGFSPQAFIGFSFAAEESESPTWSGFSNATLIVPELLLEQNGASCTITFSGVMDAAASTDELHRCWIIRTKELLTGFLPATDDPIGHSTQALTQIEVEPADAEWLDMAETALEDIRSGLLEKVVLTRRLRVAGEHSLQPARLMKWIESHYPDCVQFAMNRGDSTLVGASPESLVVLTGRSLLSDVLAGTAIRVAQDDGGHGSGEALLRNPKIRHEHRLVLDDIVRSLEPLCESLNVPSVPQVMTLPTLQHLWSPIHGQVKPGVSLLRLVSQLHPTPAVGGVPRGEALEWLARHGDSQRGWYTGAMGWLRTDGGGEFSVTLRCAILRHNIADLFSGAGIVADSKSPEELAEAEGKLKTMLDALAAS